MQLKLRASLIVTVIIGLIIPAGVSVLLTLGQREQALRRDLNADHQRMADILAYGMQQPLWNLSQDSGRPLFDSLLSDTRVTSLVVRDKEFGTFLASEHPERRRGKQLTLQRDVFYGGEVIGSVLVQIDTGQLDASIARDRTDFELTLIGQLLLSLALIIALLHARLLVPLRQLIAQSQRLARRELSEPFRWHRNDELGSLGRSLESTREALAALFDEIESKNRELESDIARRSRTEAELQRHREHLEELVRERTGELTVAKERAEVASQAKSTFLASMSHELRTPLNAILGYAQVLKRASNLDAQQRASLDVILQSGDHLLTLINDLLDLAKIEAGKFELAETQVDLPEFLRGIVDVLRMRAEQKRLTFSFEAAHDLPTTVIADDKRLRQVLLNLLGNAVKFTDGGAVRLRVTAGPAEGERVPLHFEVSDTGIGIAPEQFERIFQPFEQVGDPQRRFGGTGLGLSISRQLVRLMGGDIRIESTVGHGSNFRFDIMVRALAKPALQLAGATIGPRPLNELHRPPPVEMERLHRLALAGNMRAIRAYAHELGQQDPGCRAFADRLDAMARQYQSKAILQFVEQCLQCDAG
ncbi:HAMP domain-containing protein [Oxalobacteraceae bacterium OM1]|nr:HAMP domain-containing protein [Oxalobacteraceae bacterium OM1]